MGESPPLLEPALKNGEEEEEVKVKKQSLVMRIKWWFSANGKGYPTQQGHDVQSHHFKEQGKQELVLCLCSTSDETVFRHESNCVVDTFTIRPRLRYLAQ